MSWWQWIGVVWGVCLIWWIGSAIMDAKDDREFHDFHDREDWD